MWALYPLGHALLPQRDHCLRPRAARDFWPDVLIGEIGGQSEIEPEYFSGGKKDFLGRLGIAALWRLPRDVPP
jgi:hypothetical protein